VTTADGHVRLRFLFEAPTLRKAGDLAAALRMRGRHKVQVRHATLRQWTVIATTPPTPSSHPSLQWLEREMEDLAQRHPGCRVVGWTRLPAADQA
jgi:hypothetical protein